MGNDFVDSNEYLGYRQENELNKKKIYFILCQTFITKDYIQCQSKPHTNYISAIAVQILWKDFFPGKDILLFSVLIVLRFFPFTSPKKKSP